MLMVRPERLELVIGQPGPDLVALPVTCADLVFQGAVLRCALRDPAGNELVAHVEAGRRDRASVRARRSGSRGGPRPGGCSTPMPVPERSRTAPGSTPRGEGPRAARRRRGARSDQYSTVRLPTTCGYRWSLLFTRARAFEK